MDDKIIEDILTERIRQDGKWGEQNHFELKWLAILMEEVGEVAEVANEIHPTINTGKAGLKQYKDLRKELIHVAATCVAWMESLDRREL